jgi:hypothetical protein
MKLEAKVKEQCRQIFAEFGNDQPYMPAPALYGSAGAADFVDCMFGRYIAVECKKKGGKQTALQKLFQQGVESRGGTYLLIDGTNTDMLRELLFMWSVVTLDEPVPHPLWTSEEL